ANVYYGADERGWLYFVSSDDTKHSQMIIDKPEIAFSIVWYNTQNHKDRKAVQGKGICRPAANDEEIATGVKLHNQNIPEYRDKITVDFIHNNEYGSRVWVIEPTYIKYWDDEATGEESQEFNFDRKV
ncbi:MAG: hypothetical protein NUV82_04540, partial [Candidatus Komeilibacteria bacterium]|nr:hypothetical protein [Candidatus Komeilibacteria bacterium]